MLLVVPIPGFGIGTTLSKKVAKPPKNKRCSDQFSYPPKDQGVNTSVKAAKIQTNHSRIDIGTLQLFRRLGLIINCKKRLKRLSSNSFLGNKRLIKAGINPLHFLSKNFFAQELRR